MYDYQKDTDYDLLEKTIDGATSPELTLFLYDGAVRYANLAIKALENGDIDGAADNIVRAGSIIQEFQITLDHQFPIAEPMNDLYKYMYQRLCLSLAEENENTSRMLVVEVRDMLREFRDTWKKAMQMATV